MKRMLLIFLAGCAVATGQPREIRRAVPVEPGADERAKFLAGVPLPEGAALAPLQNSPDYAAHVKALAELSQHYDKFYFSKMRAWSARELAPRLPTNAPVYYFFGGPDAVSVLALFPDAPVYILSGLEKVGGIPDPSTLTPESLTQGLANLRESVKVVLSYGHFITKDMKTELDQSAFRGVLPLLSTFIAFTGGEILRVEPIGVKPDGTLAAPDTETSGAILPGVKITFRRAPEAREQVLYYVRADASDGALQANDAILKWAGRFGPGIVYLKAASYLLHEEYFSRIRKFLLSHGQAVLQDDSGIPFRFFEKGPWRYWLFGTYSETLDIFKKYRQPDLDRAFSRPGAAAELPFGTGYKWREGESNLLLALRIPARSAQPPQPTGPPVRRAEPVR